MGLIGNQMAVDDLRELALEAPDRPWGSETPDRDHPAPAGCADAVAAVPRRPGPGGSSSPVAMVAETMDYKGPDRAAAVVTQRCYRDRNPSA